VHVWVCVGMCVCVCVCVFVCVASMRVVKTEQGGRGSGGQG